jgi:formate hydrogenlyase subunit 6/NADH:ubiquinone oxidoreductase subunit I
MAYHEHAAPNFRNLIVRPIWMSLKAALRTFPVIGSLSFINNGYHAQQVEMQDAATVSRQKKAGHPAADAIYAADRETSELAPNLGRPLTIMYPYERLEDLEPWLFVPGEYNGRIGVIWETCTACKLCVRICPNDCLHMTTELRVDVLDEPRDGDLSGWGTDLEEGGWAAVPINEGVEAATGWDESKQHEAKPEDWRFAKVLDLSGEIARVSWNDSGAVEELSVQELYRADDQIVAGRIDMGRCMFCGLCMEACDFTSFFMTNEYDGMSGFTREELWFEANRTRVMPANHQEAVDAELAKRALKERDKRERKAAREAAKQAKA